MGGRVAEELFLRQMTSGASNDIERATDIHQHMVCEWGMSELGPATFGKKEEAIFLGREFAQAGERARRDVTVRLQNEDRTAART